MVEHSMRAGTEQQTRRLGMRMTLLAWLAQNLMTGFAFGSFGTLVTTIEREFHVPRSISTLPLPLVLLSLALIGPVLGVLVQRWSMRTLMVIGALLSAAGYGFLCFADSMSDVLLAYGVLVGPGAALLGAMLPSALVANWFEEGRGRALGIVNMPVLVGVMPLVSSWLLTHYSMRAVFAVMSIGLLLLVPALLLVIDHPARIGLRAVGAGVIGSNMQAKPVLTYGAVVRQPAYWALAFVACVLAGAAIAMAAHIVPMAEGWGVAPTRAALLLAAIGLMGAVGSPLFGWLSDRFGGPAALALNAALQALLWLSVLARPEFAVLLGIALALGITGGGMVAAFSAALSQRFGPENFGRTFGLFALMNLPFTVGMPPLLGYVFAVTGSYGLAFAGQIAVLCMAAAVGMLLHLHDGKTSPPVAAVETR